MLPLRHRSVFLPRRSRAEQNEPWVLVNSLRHTAEPDRVDSPPELDPSHTRSYDRHTHHIDTWTQLEENQAVGLYLQGLKTLQSLNKVSRQQSKDIDSSAPLRMQSSTGVALVPSQDTSTHSPHWRCCSSLGAPHSFFNQKKVQPSEWRSGSAQLIQINRFLSKHVIRSQAVLWLLVPETE